MWNHMRAQWVCSRPEKSTIWKQSSSMKNWSFLLDPWLWQHLHCRQFLSQGNLSSEDIYPKNSIHLEELNKNQIKHIYPQNSICHEELSILMTIFTLRTIPATRTNIGGWDARSCHTVIASSAQACGLCQGIAVAVVTCNHNTNHTCQCLHRYICHSSNL